MMLNPVQLWLFVILAMMAFMALLWVVQWRLSNANIVDVGWAAGLGMVAIFFSASMDGIAARRWLVGMLAGAWSLRLTIYLFFNRAWGRAEDGRYVALRRRWGTRAPLYFFGFFQVQALLVVVFAVPFVVAMSLDQPVGQWSDGIGIALWLVAILGEMKADWQLARFRADPGRRGQVCRVGLWRYSRHPNYFFEWLHWWTYVIMAMGSVWWTLTLIGPLLMLFFLFFVTGIPATEAQALTSRGEAYRAYQRTTSAFIPWFPGKESR